MYNTELEHAGVKGMKWGVREAEDTGGTPKPSRFERKMARKEAAYNRSVERGTLRVGKGSKRAAYAKAVGKGILRDMPLGILGIAAQHLSKDYPAVAVGGTLLMGAGNLVNWGVAMNEIIDIHRA